MTSNTVDVCCPRSVMLCIQQATPSTTSPTVSDFFSVSSFSFVWHTSPQGRKIHFLRMTFNWRFFAVSELIPVQPRRHTNTSRAYPSERVISSLVGRTGDDVQSMEMPLLLHVLWKVTGPGVTASPTVHATSNRTNLQTRNYLLSSGLTLMA